jgi:hypothetical protein
LIPQLTNVKWYVIQQFMNTNRFSLQLLITMFGALFLLQPLLE